MSENSQINLFFSYIYHDSEDSLGDFDVDGCLYEMTHESLPDDAHISEPSEQQQSESYSTSQFTIEFGPHGKLTGLDELYFMKDEYKMVKEKKCVCSLDLPIEIFKSRYQTSACTAKPHVQYHFVGITLIVNLICSEGHKYRFCSSHQVNGIYANNLQVAACILLSGNQFSKIERLANFLNLEFISSSTYYRFQRRGHHP